MTTFYLIRHGVTDITGKILTGRKPGFALNDSGQLQARAVAERLKGTEIHAIYSSPIERARQTAAPLAERFGLDVVVNEAFNEVEFGAWSGRSIAELEHAEDWRTFNLFRSSSRPPAGESVLDLQHRTVPAIMELCERHPGKTVAIFSHGDPIRATLMHYLGMSGDAILRFEIAPASISVVEVAEWGARVLTVNRDT